MLLGAGVSRVRTGIARRRAAADADYPHAASLVGVGTGVRGARVIEAATRVGRSAERARTSSGRAGGEGIGGCNAAKDAGAVAAAGNAGAAKATADGGPADGRVRFSNVRPVFGERALADGCRRAVRRARAAKVSFRHCDAVRIGLARLVIIRRLDELRTGVSARDSLGTRAIDASIVDATEDVRSAWKVRLAVNETRARENRRVLTFGVCGVRGIRGRCATSARSAGGKGDRQHPDKDPCAHHGQHLAPSNILRARRTHANPRQRVGLRWATRCHPTIAEALPPSPRSKFLAESIDPPGIPPHCFQKNRRGRVGDSGLGCVARVRVLRRADRDSASDARRGPPWRPSSSRAVEARAAPWASKVRKHDVADDPRDPADRRHRRSDAHHQQSGRPRKRLSSSQIRPCDEVRIRRPRRWHSVRRVAHGAIVARRARPALKRALREGRLA